MTVTFLAPPPTHTTPGGWSERGALIMCHCIIFHLNDVHFQIHHMFEQKIFNIARKKNTNVQQKKRPMFKNKKKCLNKRKIKG